MAKTAKTQKPAVQANAPAASPMPTLATLPAPQPAAPTVALRGGQAVASVLLTGKPYRTAAPHNVQWWATVTQACNANPTGAGVAAMLAAPTNPNGVPAHFVGYCIRRGYLQAA